MGRNLTSPAASSTLPLPRCLFLASQVWVKPDLRPDGLIYWGADSDSQLTKGLAALLVLGLSGCTPEEITQVGVWLRYSQP